MLKTRQSVRIDRKGEQNYASLKRDYNRQYAGMYWHRSESLKPHLFAVARQKWPKNKHVDKIFDVAPGESCVVVGTVFMELPHKPNVLDDISNDANIASVKRPERYCDAASFASVATLEDNSGRIVLTGDFLSSMPALLVTGIVVALLGRESGDEGNFEVFDCCFAGLAPQPPLPDPMRDDCLVAIVSGLKFGSSGDYSKHLMLLDFLTGRLGADEDLNLSASISRVIIAGNSMDITIDTSKKDDAGYENGARIIRNFSEFLDEASSYVAVDLMPGESDPVSLALPQKPLHKALILPQPNDDRPTVISHTNPCSFFLEGVQILACSGQNVDDIVRYNEHLQPIEVAEKILTYRHLAPTAPDTLYCYPFNKKDVFVMESTPHVFIVGNQPEFASTLYTDGNGVSVRIVTVPSFAETGQVVLLNLRTLETKTLRFDKS